MLDGAPPSAPVPTPTEPLALQRELRRAWEILKLQPSAMLQVTHAKDALEIAVVFLVTGAILSYIGGLLYPFELGSKTYALSALSLALLAVLQLLLTIGVVGVMILLARAFHAPVAFGQLFRILGYASILFCLTIVPSLTLLAFSWWFAVAYVAFRSLGQLDQDRALLVVLVGVIALFSISRLFVSFGLYLWLGRWALTGIS